MLPKSGVYFLPDIKVIDILRVLNDYKKECEDEGKYVEARKAKRKYIELKLKEQKRQKRNMKIAQSKELLSVEESQKIQFQDFTVSWDRYMREYEETALRSIESLKQKQSDEMKELSLGLKQHYLVGNRPINKDVIAMRVKERTFKKIGKYAAAERQRRKRVN